MPYRYKYSRMFGGRQYRLYVTYRRKSDAVKTARSLRKDTPGRPPGYRVRVVKTTGGRWAVYRRQKKRKGFRP